MRATASTEPRAKKTLPGKNWRLYREWVERERVARKRVEGGWIGREWWSELGLREHSLTDNVLRGHSLTDNVLREKGLTEKIGSDEHGVQERGLREKALKEKGSRSLQTDCASQILMPDVGLIRTFGWREKGVRENRLRERKV
eukprot:840657-Rhodomonas_salina.3